jgi:hypothetical protein
VPRSLSPATAIWVPTPAACGRFRIIS